MNQITSLNTGTMPAPVSQDSPAKIADLINSRIQAARHNGQQGKFGEHTIQLGKQASGAGPSSGGQRRSGAANANQTGAGATADSTGGIMQDILRNNVRSNVSASQINSIDGLSGARDGSMVEYITTFIRNNPSRRGSTRNRFNYNESQFIRAFQEAIDEVNGNTSANPAANQPAGNPATNQPAGNPATNQPARMNSRPNNNNRPVRTNTNNQPVNNEPENNQPAANQPNIRAKKDIIRFVVQSTPTEYYFVTADELNSLDGVSGAREGLENDYVKHFAENNSNRQNYSERQFTSKLQESIDAVNIPAVATSLNNQVQFYSRDAKHARETRDIFNKFYNNDSDFKNLVDAVIREYRSLHITIDDVETNRGLAGYGSIHGNRIEIDHRNLTNNYFMYFHRGTVPNNGLEIKENNVGWILAHELLHNTGYDHNDKADTLNQRNARNRRNNNRNNNNTNNAIEVKVPTYLTHVNFSTRIQNAVDYDGKPQATGEQPQATGEQPA